MISYSFDHLSLSSIYGNSNRLIFRPFIQKNFKTKNSTQKSQKLSRIQEFLVKSTSWFSSMADIKQRNSCFLCLSYGEYQCKQWRRATASEILLFILFWRPEGKRRHCIALSRRVIAPRVVFTKNWIFTSKIVWKLQEFSVT